MIDKGYICQKNTKQHVDETRHVDLWKVYVTF